MKRKSPWSQGRRGFGACMLHELAEVLKAVAQAVRSKVGRQQDPESVLAITMSRRCLEPGAKGSIHSGPQGQGWGLDRVLLRSWDGKVWEGGRPLDSQGPLSSAAHSGRRRKSPELVWTPSKVSVDECTWEPCCPRHGLQRQVVALPVPLVWGKLSFSHSSECSLHPRPVIPNRALKINVLMS